MLEVGNVVQITSMERTDAIGEVIEVREGRYIVRLRNWKSDGEVREGRYIGRFRNWQGDHLDVACRIDELRRVR